jgi:hypothetical protein
VMLSLSFLLAVFASEGKLKVEVRNSEVWLTRNGQERQLTHDRKSKIQAVLSPNQNRVAYYEPAVVILDLEGHRVDSFEPRSQAYPSGEPCASILSVAWTNDNAIAAECHLNPSLSEYIETNLATRQTVRDLFGFNFLASPHGKGVAHVGWIPHFAPPYAQSYYLQIDNLIIYPLPKGRSPVEQKHLAEPPNVADRDQQGLTYAGIHKFEPQMSWSPDFHHLALIDCLYDWTANQPSSLSAGDGVESNRRCSVAVVSRKGEAILFSLKEVANNEFGTLRLTWISSKQLSIETHDGRKIFRLH